MCVDLIRFRCAPFSKGQRTPASPIPPTGVVTAILSKAEISTLARGIAFLTDGNNREASWLATLSQTSVRVIEELSGKSAFDDR